MSEISANLKSTSADELRLKNYKATLNQRNEIEIREIEQAHDDDLKKMAEQHAFQRTS